MSPIEYEFLARLLKRERVYVRFEYDEDYVRCRFDCYLSNFENLDSETLANVNKIVEERDKTCHGLVCGNAECCSKRRIEGGPYCGECENDILKEPWMKDVVYGTKERLYMLNNFLLRSHEYNKKIMKEAEHVNFLLKRNVYEQNRREF